MLTPTLHEDENLIWKIIHAGASGYIIKSDPPVEILTAIKIAREALPYYSNTIKTKFSVAL